MSSLVVCRCRSSGCFEETYRSERGIMKRGALVSRRTLWHHRHRDNDVMLTRNGVEAGNGTGCAGPSPVLNTSAEAPGERAMLDYVMSAFNYSAPLEFRHPPTASHCESHLDGSKDSDEAGPYKLQKTPANFGFLEARAVVNRSLNIQGNSPLRHDAEALSQTLTDWKAREWRRQCASVHVREMMRASDVSTYNNSMIPFALTLVVLDACKQQ